MSAELLALLRHRVASQFYDRPEIVDAVARVIALGPSSPVRSRIE